MNQSFSAFCIGATHSGAGKTTLTLGLLRALYNRGLAICPFKCGPDYIDPTFHRHAAKNESINLDTWMMSPKGVKDTWGHHCQCIDAAVVEGVMGLFDGRRPGSLVGSTADCARILGIPVVLVVDAKGIAGSIAAMVAGYVNFHPNIKICGVIVNRVGSQAHTHILSQALKQAQLPPLIGAIPQKPNVVLPERHLGLVPFFENEKSNEWFNTLAMMLEEAVDIEALLKVSQIPRPPAPLLPRANFKNITIAYAYDQAFHFYYPDNLLLLKRMGYRLRPFSPLHDAKLPADTNILYIGGGFPECFAQQLQNNESIRHEIFQFAQDYGTIYAECGGFMYLCKQLKTLEGTSYNMCGVFNGHAQMKPKLHTLGYREATLLHPLAFAKSGDCIHGHEFHWSDIVMETSYEPLFKTVDSRGNEKKVGAHLKNVSASYIHLHFAFNARVLSRLGLS